MDNLKRDVRAAFGRQQAALGNPAEARDRLIRKALAGQSPRLTFRSMVGAAATVVVAAAIAVAVLLTHGHLRQEQPATPTLEEALTSGPAAAVPSVSDHQLVWLTGSVVRPEGSPGQGGGLVTGVTVTVIDWSGRARYRFTAPNSTPGRPNEIQSISADGTRALLADGTIINDKGTIVASVPALSRQGMDQNATYWMADDQHICAAFSNEPIASYPPTHLKGAPNATATPAQPYTLPGADHSVTLKIFALDGSVRSVATVGTGPLSVPSGPFGDSTSVLSCNATNDIAVVARYHDADVTPVQSSSNMTVSLWAVRLSNGTVLSHQPETRMALGRAFFFGSQDGQLAVEFLWNSQVAGAERDVVLHMPSQTPVPILDAEPIPDTPGLSADGTRILRRIVDQPKNQTYLELINAANGQVIRRVTLPGLLGASAIAQPNSSSFMVQVANYMAIVDRNGGVTLLHLDTNLNGSNRPGSVGLPGVPLQN